MRYLIILILLLTPNLAFATQFEGMQANYIIQRQPNLTNKVYQMPKDPRDVGYTLIEGDVWFDTLNLNLYIYSGGDFVIKRYDINVQQWIDNAKAEWAQIEDAHTKECFKMVLRALLKLYNKELE